MEVGKKTCRCPVLHAPEILSITGGRKIGKEKAVKTAETLPETVFGIFHKNK
jgi:hypothetical protein